MGTHGHDADEMLKEIHRKRGAAKWPGNLGGGPEFIRVLKDARPAPGFRAGICITERFQSAGKAAKSILF